MMKKAIVLLIAMAMLLSIHSIAAADIIKVTPEYWNSEIEIGNNDEFDMELLGGTVELDFPLLCLGADYYVGENDSTYSGKIDYENKGVWAGIKLDMIPKVTPMVYVGWQDFSIDSPEMTSDVDGFVAGAVVEYKINDFLTARGRVEEGMDMGYDYRDNYTKRSRDLDYFGLKADLLYTPLPLVDFYVGYRYKKFDIEHSHNDIEQNGLAAGVRVGF